jgi:hypothetical protein
LLDGEAVSRVPYTSGSSFGYTLAERFTYDRHARVPVLDDVMVARIERQRERAAQRAEEMRLPVHCELFKHQTKLRIDADEARRCLAQLPPKCNRFDAQGIQIQDIADRRWRLTVGRYGRVQNNITSLKRELRQHLRIRGERLAEFDLIAAQPALLALLIEANQQITHLSITPKHRKGTPWPPSLLLPRVFPSLSLPVGSGFDLYRDVVLTDDFYGVLSDVAGVDRSSAKKRFLVDVLAKDGDYPSVVEDAFRREFPDIHGFIQAINRCDHATLIRMLQRLESWLVVEQVCGSLDVPAITLHDAVFATIATMPTVERAFGTVLAELDFPMRWKVAA